MMTKEQELDLIELMREYSKQNKKIREKPFKTQNELLFLRSFATLEFTVTELLILMEQVDGNKRS